MKLRIPGTKLEAELKSEEECAKADIFIAMTKKAHDESVRNGGYDIPGNKGGYFCQFCGTECVLAPSGQRIEAMGCKITCAECMIKLACGEN